MTYRETWEKACKEGKGGMEDGRPWVDAYYREEQGLKQVQWCEECLRNWQETGICPTDKGKHFEFCHETGYGGKSFFWPSNEPLPESQP